MKRYDCPISKFRPILFSRHDTEHLIKWLTNLSKLRIYAFHQILTWTGLNGNCLICNNSMCTLSTHAEN